MSTDLAAAPLTPPPLRRDHRVHAWVAAKGLSDVGDTVWLVALAWTAVHLAGAAQAGLLVGIGTLPRAALMLVGGALADRWDPRRTIIVANAGRVVVLLGGVLVLDGVDGHTFAVLAGVALLFGVADALHDPASGTMPRQMVRADDLRPLLATFQTVGRLGRLAGAPIGGLLVAAFDIRVAMLVDAASFAAIGVVYALWLRPRFPRTPSTGASWRRDLVSGLGYVRRTPDVRTLVVALSGLNLFVGPALAVGLALRASEQHWGAHTLGVLEACVGAGAAAGALGAARWNAPRPALVGFSILVLQGIGIAALGFGGRVFVGMAATLVGITAGAASTYLSALFMLTVDQSYLGRAQSITSLADDGLMPVAMVGFGALAALTSLSAACVVCGAGMSLMCAWSGATTRLARRPLARPASRRARTSRCRGPRSSRSGVSRRGTAAVSACACSKCSDPTCAPPASPSRKASTRTYSCGSSMLRDQSNHRQPSSARVASVNVAGARATSSACSGRTLELRGDEDQGGSSDRTVRTSLRPDEVDPDQGARRPRAASSRVLGRACRGTSTGSANRAGGRVPCTSSGTTSSRSRASAAGSGRSTPHARATSHPCTAISRAPVAASRSERRRGRPRDRPRCPGGAAQAPSSAQARFLSRSTSSARPAAGVVAPARGRRTRSRRPR